MQSPKQCLSAKVLANNALGGNIFSLDFAWTGPAPSAGQFFMVKPKRSGLFLGRPLSAARWLGSSGTLRFLIARRGRGTEELAALRCGDEADLTGPLGNAWALFAPPGLLHSAAGGKTEGAVPGGEKPIALVGGGIGVAPLTAFAAELRGGFDFFAGFKGGFANSGEREQLLGAALGAPRLVIATEDGSEGERGLITGYLDPAAYRAVYVCGPEPMLKTAAAQARAAGTPCFISMERRMACGVGACLGCSVETTEGRRRCCADGPIFNAEYVIFH